MNTRNLAARCDACPHEHDAMNPREREVMALWDAGRDFAAIASALGVKRATVEKTVRRYDDRDDGETAAAIRAGSAELAARILLFHPHVALGAAKP